MNRIKGYFKYYNVIAQKIYDASLNIDSNKKQTPINWNIVILYLFISVFYVAIIRLF